MIWILWCLAGHGLTLKTGEILHCDNFWLQDPMVIIQNRGKRYALRSDLFDWTVPIQDWERLPENTAPALAAETLEKSPSGPDFLDFKIEKLEVEQGSLIDVLRLLAHRANFNLIIDSGVPETQVTFSFRHIPLRDLLEVLLSTQGLSYEYRAQHIWVYPLGLR